MAPFKTESERKYQRHIVDELFCDKEQLGYVYLGDLRYAKGENKNKDGDVNSPVRAGFKSRVKEGDLRTYLEKAGYTKRQIDYAVRRLIKACKLEDADICNLRLKSDEVYNILRMGVSVSPSPKESKGTVKFFDFDNIENNNFALAEEVSFIDPITHANSRPDLVVYVNGIALAVIELKRKNVSIDEGIAQHLSNGGTNLIPSFFTTTQFIVVAHQSRGWEGVEQIQEEMYGFKYATIGTEARYWCPWKKDTNETGIVLSDEESFKAFFRKENFMFLLRYGVISDGGKKKVLRPHQYHALRAAEPRLREKASGIIWHSQGSGKSLTMVGLASYIRSKFENPLVLIITDRKELDIQITQIFEATGNKPHRAKSPTNLLEAIDKGEKWLICTLIHKFGHMVPNNTNKPKREVADPWDVFLAELKATVRKKYPKGLTRKYNNVFVFIDECHRTQGGILHEAMKEVLGDSYMLIGFTGTPLLRDEKMAYKDLRNTSVEKFGEFIHTYLNKQAVEDKVILDLQYEARNVEQRIDPGDNDQLDKEFEARVKGATDTEKEFIKARWATLKRVYSSKERIERIGYSILCDVENHSILSKDWANGILVAENIYSAYRFYKFFQYDSDNSVLRNRVAVVTSYNPLLVKVRKNTFDPERETEEEFKHRMALKSFEDAKGAGIKDPDQYESWAKDLFVKKPYIMKLVIVVDKLLTGFDAPCASVLYIDKEMRDHALFQAVCRVNRLGVDVENPDPEGDPITTNKEYGLIVDFKNLFGNIKDAVTRFNDASGGFGGLDPSTTKDLLKDNVAKNKERLEAARKAYEDLKAKWESMGLINSADSVDDFLDNMAEYYITDSGDMLADKKRNALYVITGAMVSAYDNIKEDMARAGFSKKESVVIEDLASEAAAIRRHVKNMSGGVLDHRKYDPFMQALIDRYVEAKNVKVMIPATADFSFLNFITDGTNEDETVEKVRRQTGEKSYKGAAEVIKAKLRAVINDSKSKDPAQGEKFSKQLQELLKELEESKASFKEQAKILLHFLKDVNRGGTNFPRDINTTLKKRLWNNREELGLGNDDAEVIGNIEKAQYAVDHEAYETYREPGSDDGELFVETLREYFPFLSEERIKKMYSIIIAS